MEWSFTALWSCYDFQVRQRAVAKVHFIGNLHRKKVVSEKLVHGCVCELLAGFESPKQQDVECLVRLMNTAGQQMEATPLAKGHMDAYFLLTNCLDSNADFVPAISEHPDSSLLCYLLKPAFAHQPKSKV